LTVGHRIADRTDLADRGEIKKRKLSSASGKKRQRGQKLGHYGSVTKKILEHDRRGAENRAAGQQPR